MQGWPFSFASFLLGKPLCQLCGVPHRSHGVLAVEIRADVEMCIRDRPGYGYAKVSKGERDRWASLVEGYFALDRNVALVIQLVDMRHKPTADDLQMVDFLLQTGRPFVVVCTKSDKLNRGETEAQTALFNQLFQEQGIRCV